MRDYGTAFVGETRDFWIEQMRDMMSLGEDRVRVKFNPSDNSLVSQIKQGSAELIDLCGAIHPPVDHEGETRRLIALAQTAYEEAAMWAVKAATA